jgi:UDP-N-acetylmuramoyl-tripeptide--D-alanyl-D-alanine ligase
MQIIQTIFFIILVLFIFKVLHDSSYLLWLFQVKEYRLDRIRSFMRENIRVNFSDLAIAAGVFILLCLLFPATAEYIFVCVVLLLGFIAIIYFIFSFVTLSVEIISHSFRRPKITSKVVIIFAIYFLMFATFLFFITSAVSRNILIIFSPDLLIIFSFYLLIFNALVPVFILLAIMIVTPLSNYQKQRIIVRAKLKMKSLVKVKTIGITGSYGKTSTKEFLFAILSRKYKVVKTDGNNNTYMGVANTILGSLDESFDYFICEMGAYRIGEIKEICDLVKPFAGILTGINQQHLDLFGSIENTKKTKYELIRSLPKNGFAVINEAAESMKPKVGSNVQDKEYFSRDSVQNVRVSPERVEFEYKGIDFKLKVLGKHYIENLIAAIMTAEKLGMSLDEIKSAVSDLEFDKEYLMQKLEGINKSIFIDDSYSANPTGVIAALEYLEDAYPKHKKILVFPGIIELGKKSVSIHKNIWQKTDEICKYAYILQGENAANRKIRETHANCQFIFEKDFDKMARMLEKRIDKNTVVLFESRGAGVVMRKLLENKAK